MSRLAAGLWVQAYLMRLQIEGIPAYVLHRGDATAGAVWIKLATLDGQAALWERRYDLISDRRSWVCALSGRNPRSTPASPGNAPATGDLWVLEVEDARGRHLLDAEGLD